MELGIMYAHTCNIECRHCGIRSGPDNLARMPMELAERCIREAATVVPKIETIAFTGGEPFLFFDELEHLIALCCDLGIPARVVTNGFWGRNVERGRKQLHRLRLAGLDSINFSADKYHLEYLDARIFRDAVAIARSLGYSAIVNFVTSEREDPIALFCRLYGVSPADVVLLDEIRGAGGAPPDKILLSYGRLIGLGRASEYPEEHYRTPLATFSTQGCAEVVNRPVVYPDGDLQACCCAGGKIAAFTVGNLQDASLAELVGRMRQRTHYRFINTFGPRRLYEGIAAERADRAIDTPHASICDVCVSATAAIAPAEVDGILDRWMIRRLAAPESPPVRQRLHSLPIVRS